MVFIATIIGSLLGLIIHFRQSFTGKLKTTGVTSMQTQVCKHTKLEDLFGLTINPDP